MWIKCSLHACLTNQCSSLLLSSPVTSSLPKQLQKNHRTHFFFSFFLALGTSGVLWQEIPAGVHTDACLPVSLALQSQITLEVIAGSKVGKQEPAAGEAG